jgi:hypothetical protein
MFVYIMTETGTEEHPQVMVVQSEEEYDLTTDDYRFILRMFAEEAVNNSYTSLGYWAEFERLLAQEKAGYVGLYKSDLTTLPVVWHNDGLWSGLYIERFSLDDQEAKFISDRR